MNIPVNRYANIDKFVNIRYIYLLAQMWKLLAPGVGLVDFLTPDAEFLYFYVSSSEYHYKNPTRRVVVDQSRHHHHFIECKFFLP